MQNNLSAFKRIFVEQAEFAVHEYFCLLGGIRKEERLKPRPD